MFELLKEILGEENLADLISQAGCAECDDPDCPMAGMGVETKKIAIEPGVTPLGQFEDKILDVMTEGLTHSIMELENEIDSHELLIEMSDQVSELAKGKILPHEQLEFDEEREGIKKNVKELNGLVAVLKKDLARVHEEIASRKKPTMTAEEAVMQMIKAINKTYGKAYPAQTEKPSYEPSVVNEIGENGETETFVKVKMPEANNEWANRTWKWANGFIKRFGGYISFKQAGRNPSYLYIAVSELAIGEWISMK